MSMTLYQMAAEYKAAADILADCDLDAQTVADTLESLPGDIKAKAANVARMYLSIDVLGAAQIEAGKKLIARGKATEARAEHLRDYLAANMQLTGITKIEDDEVCITWRKSSAVEITGSDLIPAEYWTQPETPPPVVSKSAIAAAIKAGKEVPGAHMQQRQTLQIK